MALKSPGRRPGYLDRRFQELQLTEARRQVEDGQISVPGMEAPTTPGDAGFVFLDGQGNKQVKRVDTNDINDDQVTYAKFQNVAFERILARKTALAGDVEECTIFEVLGFGNIVLPLPAIADIATADAVDLATVIALANDTKAKVNEILQAWRDAGVLVP